MAELLDFAALTQPIAGDDPCGPDLRGTDAFYEMRDARSAARTKERQADAGDTQADPREDWQVIRAKAPALIGEQSKDLDLVAWLCEALLRQDGFAGLRDGFRLGRELIEKYWDGIHPRPDEDGIATTVSSFANLNGVGAEGALIQPIRKAWITSPLTGEPVQMWAYERAIDSPAAPAPAEEGGEASESVLAKARNGARESGIEFYRTLLADLQDCIDAFDKLSEAFGERCSAADAPPSSTIRSTLEWAQRLTKGLADEIFPGGLAADGAGAAAAAESGGDVPAAAGRPAGALSVGGAIQTRDDAFRLVAMAADFFKRTEPHSPVGYTLEEVVRRGRLPLADLLKELIADDEVRSRFLIAAGIRPPPPE
ncbi:MAG: type VI secretion system protein TssA [Rhodospirillaceae bacterium]